MSQSVTEFAVFLSQLPKVRWLQTFTIMPSFNGTFKPSWCSVVGKAGVLEPGVLWRDFGFWKFTKLGEFIYTLLLFMSHYTPSRHSPFGEHAEGKELWETQHWLWNVLSPGSYQGHFSYCVDLIATPNFKEAGKLHTMYARTDHSDRTMWDGECIQGERVI